MVMHSTLLGPASVELDCPTPLITLKDVGAM